MQVGRGRRFVVGLDDRETVLRVSELEKSYSGGIRALDGISLEAPPGLFGLLGPNGAGKTTLMRILASLLPPDSGSATLGSIDLIADPTRGRQILGYLPQEFGVHPGVPARTLLDYIARLKGITDKRGRRHRVEELLEQVNLERDAHRPVSDYSGGMRQRFGVAQALLANPRLLIADEPTAGLDPSERNRLHRLLIEVGTRAVVIISTHIVEDVSNLCSQVVILGRGRVIASNTPESLCRALDGRVWTRTVQRLEKEKPSPSVPILERPSPRGTVQVVVADRPPDSSFERKIPDLEDAYHAALNREGIAA